MFVFKVVFVKSEYCHRKPSANPASVFLFPVDTAIYIPSLTRKVSKSKGKVASIEPYSTRAQIQLIPRALPWVFALSEPIMQKKL